MLARDLISDIVPSIRTSDTGSGALSLMETFRVSHLPIVNNVEFLGLISDSDIYDLNMIDEPIGNHKLSLFSPFVYKNQHIFEVVEIASRLSLSVIPVIDENRHYLGLITQNDLLQYVAELFALKNPGGIIVLEINQNDYYLSQIAQIIESNDVRILSIYVSSSEDSTKMNVTIKVNRNDLAPVIQTFIRYDYNIKASFMEDEELEIFYKNRYEQFMRYLNV